MPNREVFLSVRMDPELEQSLRELRRLYDDLPSKSEAVRRAVISELARLRKEKARK